MVVFVRSEGPDPLSIQYNNEIAFLLHHGFTHTRTTMDSKAKIFIELLELSRRDKDPTDCPRMDAVQLIYNSTPRGGSMRTLIAGRTD